MFTISGRGAAHGVIAKQGAETALAEVNASGGILGREVVGVFVDEGSPDTATQKAENLVNTDKVSAIIGVISSAVAPLVAAAAKGLQVPLLITTAQTNVVTVPTVQPVHVSNPPGTTTRLKDDCSRCRRTPSKDVDHHWSELRLGLGVVGYVPKGT